MDSRSLGQGGKARQRIQAVKAVESGKRQREVAKIFGVREQAVSRWMKVYRAEGLKGLKAKAVGRPKEPSKLKPLECAWVIRAITDKTPDQLKLPFYLWTQDAVRQLIEQKYGVVLSRWTVGRMLKKWGLTPQKPAKKSYFQKDSAVKKWLKEEYPGIKARASRENASIQWLDEMGARSDDQVGRTYGRRGQTPTIEVSGNRFRCNMISSITNYGQMAFMMFTQRFTQEVFLCFLKKLIYKKKRKIFLITDSHPVHKGKKVTQWLILNQKKIEAFFLPSYSPELNSAEYLNHDVKANAVRRKRAKTQPEMISNITSFLEHKKQYPHKIKAYFKAKHVRYAA